MTGTLCMFIMVCNNCESSYFQHTISSGANHSSTGSEASGSGATTLKSYHNPDHNQLNSQICTLFVKLQVFKFDHA